MKRLRKVVYPVPEQKLSGIRCEVIVPYKANRKRIRKKGINYGIL